MNKRQLALYFLGLMLIVYGTIQTGITMSVIKIDTTAPQAGSMTPVDGGSYDALTSVSIYLEDPVSGTKSVTYTDESDTLTLTLTEGTSYSGTWSADHPTDVLIGSHEFSFTVADDIGNDGTINGQYTIKSAGGLSGKFYADDIEITDQIIRTPESSIQFEFIKGSGSPDDTQITAEITRDDESPSPMTNTEIGTWFKTLGFSENRSYSVNIHVSDQVKSLDKSCTVYPNGFNGTSPDDGENGNGDDTEDDVTDNETDTSPDESSEPDDVIDDIVDKTGIKASFMPYAYMILGVTIIAVARIKYGDGET